jgi:5-methylcytosine-specific restriction endonuclease McrA
MRIIKPERKLRLLRDYMNEWIDAWPTKFRPFDRWLESTFDKALYKGKMKAVAMYKARCRYCRREFDETLEKTKDHVVPLSRGGLDHKENRVPCCFECNQWKADRTLIAWLKEIRRRIKKDQPYKSHYGVSQMGRIAAAIETVLAEVKANETKASIYKVKK